MFPAVQGAAYFVVFLEPLHLQSASHGLCSGLSMYIEFMPEHTTTWTNWKGELSVHSDHCRLLEMQKSRLYVLPHPAFCASSSWITYFGDYNILLVSTDNVASYRPKTEIPLCKCIFIIPIWLIPKYATQKVCRLLAMGLASALHPAKPIHNLFLQFVATQLLLMHTSIAVMDDHYSVCQLQLQMCLQDCLAALSHWYFSVNELIVHPLCCADHIRIISLLCE